MTARSHENGRVSRSAARLFIKNSINLKQSLQAFFVFFLRYHKSDTYQQYLMNNVSGV